VCSLQSCNPPISACGGLQPLHSGELGLEVVFLGAAVVEALSVGGLWDLFFYADTAGFQILLLSQ
jgi:hypothetical protein